MKLGQIKLNGVPTAAIFEDGGCRVHSGPHARCDVVLDPIAGRSRRAPAPVAAEPVIPIHPPEVWGCGCTYETSASFRDAEHGTREGMYAYVYREARPEVFFKGTARDCVGHARTPSASAPIRTSPRPSPSWPW